MRLWGIPVIENDMPHLLEEKILGLLVDPLPLLPSLFLLIRGPVCTPGGHLRLISSSVFFFPDPSHDLFPDFLGSEVLRALLVHVLSS